MSACAQLSATLPGPSKVFTTLPLVGAAGLPRGPTIYGYSHTGPGPHGRTFIISCLGGGHSLAHLYLIAWRFIITDFYQLHYDNELTPFDEANAYSIYTRTIERYTTLVMARAHKIRATIHTRERSVFYECFVIYVNLIPTDECVLP